MPSLVPWQGRPISKWQFHIATSHYNRSNFRIAKYHTNNTISPCFPSTFLFQQNRRFSTNYFPTQPYSSPLTALKGCMWTVHGSVRIKGKNSTTERARNHPAPLPIPLTVLYLSHRLFSKIHASAQIKPSEIWRKELRCVPFCQVGSNWPTWSPGSRDSLASATKLEMTDKKAPRQRMRKAKLTPDPPHTCPFDVCPF